MNERALMSNLFRFLAISKTFSKFEIFTIQNYDKSNVKLCKIYLFENAINFSASIGSLTSSFDSKFKNLLFFKINVLFNKFA